MELHKIQAPSLGDAQYGKNVSEQFDYINDNFKRVSSYDFIRGIQGKSVRLERHALSADIVDGAIRKDSVCEAICNAIVEDVDEKAIGDVGGVGYKQFFLNRTAGELVLIYYDNEATTAVDDQIQPSITIKPGLSDLGNKIPTGGELVGEIVETPTIDTNISWKTNLLGVLPYTYFDPRFQRRLININSDYNDVIDLSCIIGWNDGKFVRINAFPTIYYDQNVSAFCWMIGGNRSGLIAQGPRGLDGRSGNMLIVRADNTVQNQTNSTQYQVNYYLNDKGEWANMDELEQDVVGNACIVFKSTSTSPTLIVNHSEYWISNLGVVSTDSSTTNVYTVTCSDTNKITSQFSWNDLIKIFSGMGSSKDLADGIFLPIAPTFINEEDSTTDQYVHMMMSVPVGKEENAYDKSHSEFRIGPCLYKDINGGRHASLQDVGITITKKATAQGSLGEQTFILDGISLKPNASGKYEYQYHWKNETGSFYSGTLFGKDVKVEIEGESPIAAYMSILYPVIFKDVYIENLYGCTMSSEDINQIVADAVENINSI